MAGKTKKPLKMDKKSEQHKLHKPKTFLKKDMNTKLIVLILIVLAVSVGLMIYFVNNIQNVWDKYNSKNNELRITNKDLNTTSKNLNYYMDLSENLTNQLHEEFTAKEEFQNEFNRIYNTTKDLLDETNKSLKAKIKTISYLNDKVSTLEDNVDSLTTQNLNLSKKLNDVDDTYSEIDDKANDVQDSLSDLSSQINACKSDVTLACIQSIDSEYNNVDDDIDSLDSRISDLGNIVN